MRSAHNYLTKIKVTIQKRVVGIVNLKDRDLRLLSDIYYNRAFTAKQIARLYYDDSKYGYKRIKQLEDAGYLGSTPLLDGIKKVTQYYWITDKGISLLNIKDARRAQKNIPKSQFHAKVLLAVNEIYITLMSIQQNTNTDRWTWEESRELKVKYKFNQGDMISAVLTSKIDGKKYGVYVPHAQSDMKKLAQKIKNEIEKHVNLKDNLIFCTTKELFRHMQYYMPGTGSTLRILPHGPGINLVHNVLYDYSNWSRDVLQKYSNMPPQAVNKGLLFADYADDDFYYAELLTLDNVKMKYLKRYAHDDKFPNPIKVLCWDTQEEQLRKMFEPRSNEEPNKLNLTVLDFDNNEYYTGVVKNQAYTVKKIQKPKTTNELMTITTISVTPEMSKFLESLPPNEKSAFVRKAIEATKEYKEYIGGEV